MISAQHIKAAALRVGFDACGIAAATAIPPAARQLGQWLSLHHHASMLFMEEHQAMRHDPRILYPGAKSVISVLVGYRPSECAEGPLKIAQYAYGEDYHEQIKKKLFQLIAEIQKEHPDFEARPFVDTAPIMDKYWAAQCGLGWIGKNSLLINPRLGSYCNIGELVTSAEIDQYDTPIDEKCGSCHACISACPNNAISGGCRLAAVDARKCASYHTIENRDEQIPSHIQLSGYLFGCDCCQLACPHNREAAICNTVTPERKQALNELISCDEKAFKKATRHSAMNRIKYSQWQRNISANRSDK